MKNPKSKKKLRLHSETLRVLKPGEMAAVAGGAFIRNRDSDCDTCAERGC